MKKVGIMTFHRAENYGAFLQAYALSSYIDNNFDADAYLVDYINPKNEKSKKACSVQERSKNPGKAIGKFVLSYGDIRKRNKLFFQDRKSYLKIRRADITKQDLMTELQQYDVLIAGSDQVWNLKITGDDYSYLLEDASEKQMKASYAAGVSMSKEDIASNQRFQGLVQGMDYLSFRELSTSRIFEELLPGKHLSTVVDPVFLQTSDFWREKAPENGASDYILVFMAGKSNQTRNLINAGKKLAEKTSKSVFFLSNDCFWYEYRDVKHTPSISPLEFVRWIDHAYCVITNSFHATAFSLILHTNVYSEVNIKRADRIINLLKMCDLDNRLICDGGIVQNCAISPEEWKAVDAAIEKERIRAHAYLANILA